MHEKISHNQKLHQCILKCCFFLKQQIWRELIGQLTTMTKIKALPVLKYISCNKVRSIHYQYVSYYLLALSGLHQFCCYQNQRIDNSNHCICYSTPIQWTNYILSRLTENIPQNYRFFFTFTFYSRDKQHGFSKVQVYYWQLLMLCFIVHILGSVFTGSYQSNSNVASLSGTIDSIQCSFVTADSGQIYDDDENSHFPK